MFELCDSVGEEAFRKVVLPPKFSWSDGFETPTAASVQ